MKLLWAVAVFAGLAATLAAGLVQTVRGNPWLLIISLAAFVALFYRFGCTEPDHGA